MVDYLRYVKPNRKFTRNLLVTERYHRIDVCCSPGGEVACRRYHQHEHDCGGCEGYRIECRHSKQQLSNEASQQEGAAKPERYSDVPICRPCDSTRRRTSAGPAPIAIRIPNSWVLLATMNDITP